MSNHRVDWALLLESGLALALAGLGIALYWVPAATGLSGARWWHWLVLGMLFFIVVGLGTSRRRRRGITALHRTIRKEGKAES